MFAHNDSGLDALMTMYEFDPQWTCTARSTTRLKSERCICVFFFEHGYMDDGALAVHYGPGVFDITCSTTLMYRSHRR